MNIVMIGAGTVGSAICKQLVKEGHDLTVVDQNEDILTELANDCDLFGVVGSGVDIETLRKAGVDKADLLLAVTSSDEVNLLCCVASRKLGAKHSIARIRNREYTEMMQLLRSDLNLSLTINPELATAKEIYRSLRFPSAAKIETFCKGRVELAELAVEEGSPMCGITLNDLRNSMHIRFLICAVLRNGEAIVPNGYFCLQAGDVICVTAPEENIAEFFKELGAYKDPVRDVMIVGGGRVTFYLETLLKKSRIRSTIIDAREDVCRSLSEQFDCSVICADGAEQEVLLEQGLDQADAFLALSEVDEENIISSMYANTRGVKKRITMIQKLNHPEFFKSAGLDTIVSPKTSTASYILRYVRAMSNVRGSEIESLHNLMNGQIEAIEFLIKEDMDGFTDVPLKDLKLQSDVLIACIVRHDKVIIPSGGDVISNGDTVIIVTKVGQMKGIREILK